MQRNSKTMCVCKNEAGLVMLQDGGYAESSGGLKLKKTMQIGVNCESCECQFKELGANRKPYTVLLSRGE